METKSNPTWFSKIRAKNMHHCLLSLGKLMLQAPGLGVQTRSCTIMVYCTHCPACSFYTSKPFPGTEATIASHKSRTSIRQVLFSSVKWVRKLRARKTKDRGLDVQCRTCRRNSQPFQGAVRIIRTKWQ
jgi:hypothetical protein